VFNGAKINNYKQPVSTVNGTTDTAMLRRRFHLKVKLTIDFELDQAL